MRIKLLLVLFVCFSSLKFGVYSEELFSVINHSRMLMALADTQINTHTTGSQEMPWIAAKSDGGFIIVWQDNARDLDGYGIYYKMFNKNGSVLVDDTQVNTVTANIQEMPRVIVLADDGFVILWTSRSQDGNGAGVYAKIFDSDGSVRVAPFQVNTFITDEQDSPQAAALENGNFIVTWESKAQIGSGEEIYAQAFTSSGATVGSEFRVNDFTSNNQDAQNMAALSGSAFVVSWSSEGQACAGGCGFDVYFKIYNSDFSVRVSEFQANEVAADNQGLPMPARLTGGKFVIAWDSHSSGTWDVKGRVFNLLRPE